MNFTQDYKIYSDGDEAPLEYHLWSGLCALSACCGPRLWVDMERFNINPNLYVLLVGPPGIRKSTAMDAAAKLCRHVGNIPMAPSTVTRQAMIDWMADPKEKCKRNFKVGDKACIYTQAAIFSDEFVNLVQSGGDPINYISMLTGIYNPIPNFDDRTIGRGTKVVPYPYVTLLGCMTPEITANLIRENALSGGFSRRCIYIYADHNNDPVPFPKKTPAQVAAFDRLVSRARAIQQLIGQFKFSPQAIEIYEKHYRVNHEEMKRANSSAVQNFLQSKMNICIKVGMLLALGEADDLVIHDYQMDTAWELVTSAQRHINSVFSGVGRNPHAMTMANLVRHVEMFANKPPYYIKFKTLAGAFRQHATMEDVEKLVKELEASDPKELILADLLVSGQKIKVVVLPEHLDKFKTSQTPPPS